jgi:hypothetical protein
MRLTKRLSDPPLAAALCLAAGAASGSTLVCSTAGDPDGPPALVGDAWGESPVLQGPGEPLPVVRYERGRTVIFDARSAVLYFDRNSHAFAYTQMGGGTMTTVRGTCEEGS